MVQVCDGGSGQARAGMAVLGELVDPGPAGADEGELRGHEEPVRRHQQDGDPEPQEDLAEGEDLRDFAFHQRDGSMSSAAGSSRIPAMQRTPSRGAPR